MNENEIAPSNEHNKSSNDDGPRGPAELGTSTRTVNRITAPEAYEIIGGQRFNVNSDTRDERNRAMQVRELHWVQEFRRNVGKLCLENICQRKP